MHNIDPYTQARFSKMHSQIIQITSKEPNEDHTNNQWLEFTLHCLNERTYQQNARLRYKSIEQNSYRRNTAPIEGTRQEPLKQYNANGGIFV